MQSRHMGPDPDSNIRRHVDVFRSRIWLVSIDRRSPVDGDAAENEAEKDWHIQPVTPAHQEMVLLGHEHAGLFQRRARRVRSEEHTSELQSQSNLVCRLLLEKKKKKNKYR